MKLRLKQSLNLCLIVSTLILGACGKKENKVNSSLSGSSPFYLDNPALASNPQIVNQVQSIKANVTCMNGYRLTNDVSFYVNGGVVGANRIGGNFQPGFLTNGTISQMWVGVSVFRDIMFVTKVSNGSQVVGYNVTLSFCEMKNTYAANLPSIISNERALTQFVAPYGIILDTNSYCGYGVVDWAQNTRITSQRSLNNPYSPPDAYPVTSFTKPNCNGQF
jgi:hypothetical protein